MPSAESIHDIFISLRSSLARAVVGIVPPKEVEDIVQETYVRVCQIEGRVKIREPRSFLFKTAHNLALDHVKRAESRLSVSIEESGDLELSDRSRVVDETFDSAVSDQEFCQFCDAVRHLPTQCRRAFVLKKVYGCSQREIAVEMNISESTVEKHIAEGIKRCHYFMMRHGTLRAGNNKIDMPAEGELGSGPGYEGNL